MNDISSVISCHLALFPDAKILMNEPMSAHTTVKIGGPADALFIPKSAEEAAALLEGCRREGVRCIIVGNGSDLLCTDGRLEAAVIKMTGLNGIEINGDTLTVGAGAQLSRIAAAALDASLTGFEFANGIPGTLGGAVFMNAGAYGGEMKDVIIKVTALNKDLDTVTFSGDECAFSYRDSVFSCGDYVILSAEIGLTPGDKDEIRAKMDDLARRRREKQPLELPSAGSTFKRPETGYAAALIEQAGLKGFSVGGAQVSEKHSGFVVNTGGATYEDFTAVMAHVQKTVYESAGVMLTPEVRIIR